MEIPASISFAKVLDEANKLDRSELQPSGLTRTQMASNSFVAVACATLMVAAPVVVGAQRERFQGRLSPLPVDARTAATITGEGVVSVMAGSIRTMLRYLAEKQVNPVIDDRIPLKEAAHAHELFESHQTIGKLSLKP